MYLRPNAAIVQLGDNISAVRKVKAEAAAAITALQRVIADRSLQGDGFNALREKLEGFDLRLLKGLHSLCGEQETRYRWHQNSISSRFWGCSEVNSYSIQAQMQSVNAQIQRVVDLATAEGWLNLATLGAWSYYSLRQTYRTLEEKLEQLYQCDWETGALYETNIAIVECLNEGIQYINSMYYDP
ncbi:MAG: LXG domain-containing protein, partial [Coriobacteriales bacterium]|nr:LXG domain-containing protein [Coriobacteriales bacterium]